MRTALKFAYDGTTYFGYARQPGLSTIEGEILQVLKGLGVIKSIKDAKPRVASRTDKGVSSFGNVIALSTIKDIDNIQEINKDLNRVWLYGLKKVSDRFYPRYANLRHYRYYLKKYEIDENLLFKAASLFTGKHNFSNFAKIEKNRNPVRDIGNIVIEERDNLILIDVFARTFLWHQIRRVIEALRKAAEKKIKLNAVRMALDNPKKKIDFGIAPANCLVLVDIIYNFEFECIKELKDRILKNLEKEIISNCLSS